MNFMTKARKNGLKGYGGEIIIMVFVLLITIFVLLILLFLSIRISHKCWKTYKTYTESSRQINALHPITSRAQRNSKVVIEEGIEQNSQNVNILSPIPTCNFRYVDYCLISPPSYDEAINR